ncbi:aldehyde dehydrogenase family 3 member B1 [Exaiptasia diaphana]|uniref:Aldehyde dehydrogenase domain-containing protein n=1 Tax=Exaiptasia diaphana TaxID=2652724 RepID=A0A913YFR1_EXADI|nr:aldehyde dehydrogenase family 3 member B1 [Exaiptasia diaphana]
MEAAAKNLTRVTLELGGKSPCYIDDECDLAVVANRLAWGRFSNAGQTCVAPDYVLCSPEIQSKLIKHLKETIFKFYGQDPRYSPNYGRIINERHFQRLKKLLSHGECVIGGETDEKDRFISPTVLTGIKPSDPSLPFGGVGGSGMGAYHGKHSFDVFSHKKGCLVKSLCMESMNA